MTTAILLFMLWILWNLSFVITIVATLIGIISVGFFAGIGVGVFTHYLLKFSVWFITICWLPKLLEEDRKE